jgi:hypothetical protein
MTSREQLIQELAEVPDELIKVMLDFLHRVQTTRSHHPLVKFAGILSDDEGLIYRKQFKLIVVRLI